MALGLGVLATTCLVYDATKVYFGLRRSRDTGTDPVSHLSNRKILHGRTPACRTSLDGVLSTAPDAPE
jgi:hypothetical protein